jgi:hypothetical protein
MQHGQHIQAGLNARGEASYVLSWVPAAKSYVLTVIDGGNVVRLYLTADQLVGIASFLQPGREA